jgi:MarR family transcriptional regulator, organic hydroperoxide resistance regulator
VSARRTAADVALTDAARASEHLDAIRKVVRDSVWEQARQHPVPLTPPQVLALQMLVEALRETSAGLSLSELSQRMGLAHSTVSGIVTRLERQGLVQRSPHQDDRRFVHIELTRPVRGWLQDELPRSRLSPLAAALGKANRRERATILEGLATLQRLLEEARP